MKEIVFCLEEPSAKRFLEGIISRIYADNIPVRYIVFEGKQDLEKQLGRRLRGYRNPDAKFVVMRDQDSAPDCKAVKQKLREICDEAGKFDAVVRVACRELEAFYWGDLKAVERALKLKNLAKLANRAQFRDSDSIVNPARELQKATGGLYQKMAGSEAIGKELCLDNCTSRSFQALRSAIIQIAT